HTLAILLLQAARQLSDQRGLAGAVHAHDQDNVWARLGRLANLLLECSDHLGLEHISGLTHALDAVAVAAILGAIHEILSRLHTNIGLDQQRLQVVPQLIGDRVVDGEQARDLAEEAFAGFLGSMVDLLLFLLGLFFSPWRILAMSKQSPEHLYPHSYCSLAPTKVVGFTYALLLAAFAFFVITL